MRYKITIEYDGTNYVGWQKQPDQIDKSIEEILEKAIFQMTGEQTKIIGSGRTDAGVHAVAQVADFAISKEFDAFRMMAGLNNHLLLTNIVVTGCEIVADNFNSRFDAKMRHYRYVIVNRRTQLALDKNRAWHVPLPLDVVAMQLAANYLVGSFDFSAFRDAECQSKSAIKTVTKLTVEQKGEKIIIEISAKSFLHHMVRNIVGTLVWVGSERITIDDMLIILESRDRKNSGPNAPACGLYFLGVDY
ncbi:MAG: tRNA pseudouridine(38-40) synthase TruA [Rickettsiales bacterium]|nr:tRNA pseudouridine(38-40) synthase TruA [Rickettsiales bacterium]